MSGRPGRSGRRREYVRGPALTLTPEMDAAVRAYARSKRMTLADSVRRLLAVGLAVWRAPL